MEYNVYFPNKQLKLGIKIWCEMFRDLFNARELVWRLFVRDWLARYKQSVLGVLWAVVMPFIAIGTFMYLNKAGVLNIASTGVPYPIYALIGLTVWQLFATGINSGCMSLVSSGNIISKINFPLEALVFSSVAQAIFEFMVKCCLIIAFFFAFHYRPTWGIVLFPVAVVPMLFFTMGLSLLLSLVNGVVRDTANVVTILSTFLMFLTPVLYPISSERFLIFKLNILTPLVEAPRDLIVRGHMTEPIDFFVAATLSFLFFLMSWRIFYLAKTKIPERL